MGDLYTFVAHKDMPYANPFSVATMEQCMELLALPHGARVVDFGAGSCELPIRLVERYVAEVVAVELSPRMAALAREKILARVVRKELPGGVTVHEGDAGAFRASINPASFDLAVCIGSSHALGGFANMVEVLARLTRPGGQVLVGEGFWETPPAPDYLKATGIDAAEFTTFEANVETAAACGLMPQWAVSATEREWDQYEWGHSRNIDAFASAHAEDVAARAMLARSRTWREAYVKWGRGTLGFGLFLFRRG
jgi:cyclopropane fatty-acyl-phospholipid synthase-like methyltransferase